MFKPEQSNLTNQALNKPTISKMVNAGLSTPVSNTSSQVQPTTLTSQPKNSKFSLKYIIGGILLLVLILGSGTGTGTVAGATATPITSTKAMCGEYCSRNSDCAQSDHICYFNQCRLATYPDRTNCTAPQQTTTVAPPAEVAVGCNENCRANSDCSNSSHICFEGKCRLESYPNSSSCTIPSSPDQPKMPAELPKSGSDDLMNWIKAGIGILGAGALLLLL